MIAAGLCEGCRHRRTVRNDRGSRFVLCLRSRTDPAFPRYPPLPVRRCAGFEPQRETPAPEHGSRSGPSPETG